jgi:hypothetical protein
MFKFSLFVLAAIAIALPVKAEPETTMAQSAAIINSLAAQIETASKAGNPQLAIEIGNINLETARSIAKACKIEDFSLWDELKCLEVQEDGIRRMHQNLTKLKSASF